MIKIFVRICLSIFILAPVVCVSEELTFPMTESEIVKALEFRDKQIVHDGVVYESKNGRVFKVIGDKRYRIRGIRLAGVEHAVPKTGALIYFDIDSAEVLPTSYPLLSEYGKALSNGLRNFVIVVAGHTDSTGTLEYNRKLSENRAKAVKEYLLNNFNIKPNQILAKGYGETKPIADNGSDEGRKKNRRVEFIRIE